MRAWFSAVFVLLCVSQSLNAQPPKPFVTASAEVSGFARVIDGDTLDIDGKRIRLSGIDAPEMKQTCWGAEGKAWPCGREARDRLTDLVANRLLRCEEQGLDRYGRTLGRCFLGQADLQAWLVHQGLAVSYRQYSHDYDSNEDAARIARVGLWAGEFDMPSDWRRNKRD